jgi:acyl-CoA synthetase (AMP-forming)/AMP-acid ligase II
MEKLRALSYFDIFERNALYRGDSLAIHYNGKNITYAELFRQTSVFAAGLKRLNLAAGTRIAVLCKNHPVFFNLFGAASALNLVLVLINRRLSREEILHVIEDTSPTVLFCDSEMADQAKELAKLCSCIRHCLVVDEDKEFISLYESEPLSEIQPSDGNDPYIIIHTAAVQGKPRGAVLSQSNIILANQQIIQAFKLNSEKSYLNILPLFHVMGVNLGLALLQTGGKNIIQEKFEPSLTLSLMQERKINILGSFPPILSKLTEALNEGNYDISSLEIVAGLDTPDNVKNWESCTGSKFWTMYGQTETSGLITFAEYFKKPGSAGVVSPLASIRIVDDCDNILPVGSTGEIVVRGPLVFQGYWNADELNAQTFREGWHHTGDLGMIDSESFLFFKGRKAEKELIKPGGENVFPAEVEKAILKHEAVKEVCVFGVPDPKFGEGIKAVCSLNSGMSLTKDELISFCGSLIAGYKKPKYVEFIEELPKTRDGITDRQKIKTQYT